jgi:hypothetical protein
MTTVVVAGVETQLFRVTVTEYTPELASVTLGMEGFCDVELKEGPVHVYVAPATADAVRLRFAPVHRGPLFDIIGGVGLPGSESTSGPTILLTQPFNVT